MKIYVIMWNGFIEKDYRLDRAYANSYNRNTFPKFRGSWSVWTLSEQDKKEAET